MALQTVHLRGLCQSAASLYRSDPARRAQPAPSPRALAIQKNQGSLMLLQCIVDEEPPVLPVDQFSEEFVHFVTQCMRRNPKERPAPNKLMDHSFMVQYNDGSTEVVSMWVCGCLEQRNSQQAQGHM
ncbi:hypothetical protein CRUP_034424 [Coryphaenoides rupestris]|nr:hypothetical protein CRUP_034424 [Coryphaenoides rupestris]